jgi:formate dehydrogenase subunit gamma
MSSEKLTLEQRKALKEMQLTKHYVANILTHWFNVFMWLLLLPTGFGILLGNVYPATPTAWNRLMHQIFGGPAELIYWHQTWGHVWMIVLTFNIFIGFRRYFLPFASTRMLLDKDDLRWMMVKPWHMLGLRKHLALPSQDAYNAGQKIYSYVIILGSFFIGLTGVIMTYSERIPTSYQWTIQWAMPIHFLAVGITFAGIIIHVYMGAIFPEERSAFFSMFNGKVNGLYAYLHHRKWYLRKIAERDAWEAKYQAEFEQAAAPTAGGD